MSCFHPSLPGTAIKDKDADGPGPRDKILWKWLKGVDAGVQADFGDPTSSADYGLCLYTGSTPALVTSLAFPSGSPWEALSDKGYKYKDLQATNDGLFKAQLKGGDAGKPRAFILSREAGTPIPTLPLDTSGDVIVQLSHDDNSLCWESRFSSAIKSTDVIYKAKTP